MPLAVVAIGGNALIKDAHLQSVPDQYMASVNTMGYITSMIQSGWDIVVTHGNGPQVGYILLRSELGIKYAGMHSVPLDSCGADTQGAIGYFFQQVLRNEFMRRGMNRESVTVVTRVLVDKEDPAFKNPSKPVGSFMTAEEAESRRKEDRWDVVEDAGRGWRRVVASPLPVEILEVNAIKTLVRSGFIVIAVGGGGIPVYKRPDGVIAGVEAVIDKDLASALLAERIGADMLLISTAVDKVCLNYGKTNQRTLDRITVSEAEKYLKEGHFAAGSMAPKIKAAVNYLKSGGLRAVITSPEKIADAINGKGGTEIIP